MAIGSRVLETTPEGRLADRVQTLERQIRDLTRPAVAGIQHAKAVKAGGVNTNLGGPQDLGGPEVSVEVPDEDALVLIYATWTFRSPTGGKGSVWIVEATDLAAGLQVGVRDWTTDTQTSLTFRSRGDDPTDITHDLQLPGTLALVNPTPGTRTYSMQYSSAGGATSYFTDRRLWVVVV